MANQTNRIVNGNDTSVTLTLATVATVIPPRSSLVATGTDAEFTTIAATAGVAVMKSTTTQGQRLWIADALRAQD